MAERGQAPGGGIQPHIAWAAVTAVTLAVVATGLFVAGFFTGEMTRGGGDGTAVVAQPTTTPKATATPQPTALPAITVSDGGDPSWGATDAKVTVIEFGDYQ